MKRFEAQHADGYITADIESPLAKVKMDIHNIPFESQRFDVVMCNHVLEHVKDDVKALKEIQRVLKSSGWAILQVPFFSPVPIETYENDSITDPKEREKIFGQSDHVRKYGKDYAQRISVAGFHVVEDSFVQSFSASEIQRLGLQSSEIIYRAIKK